MKAMRSRWFGSMFAWILNTKPVILRFVRLHRAARRGLRARSRREFGQRVDKLLDAEVLERAAEQDRRHMALEKGRLVEALQALDREIELIDRLGALVLGQERRHPRIVGAGDGDRLARPCPNGIRRLARIS